jgi:hypothetical protein
MILQISPDGQAVVGGPQLDLPVDKLMTLASGQVKELGETHGLRGLYADQHPRDHQHAGRDVRRLTRRARDESLRRGRVQV